MDLKYRNKSYYKDEGDFFTFINIYKSNEYVSVPRAFLEELSHKADRQLHGWLSDKTILETYCIYELYRDMYDSQGNRKEMIILTYNHGLLTGVYSSKKAEVYSIDESVRPSEFSQSEHDFEVEIASIKTSLLYEL